MTDLIDLAKSFAISAHQRIDQRRKYSNQPYHVHLEAVARLVASVTDDQEMIAAAWLHDVVEDTSATFEDIESLFGTGVATLVEQLTDVSRPSDGNRATRKAIDHRHLAQTSSRAKTIKLADLIDNCADIVHHDPRFARVFLNEMKALLEVLGEGDAILLRKAHALHGKSEQKISRTHEAKSSCEQTGLAELMPDLASPRILRKFLSSVTVRDIVDPLLSFDSTQKTRAIEGVLKRRHMNLVGIRVDGVLQGFSLRSDIESGKEPLIGKLIRHISKDQVVEIDTPLIDVVGILSRHDYCFVQMFDSIIGVIERNAMNKPVVRMWLFGVISHYELEITNLVERLFPNETWYTLLSLARLEKAQALQFERKRRKQYCKLVDCLQLSDKVQIMLEHPAFLDTLGFSSKRSAKLMIKELESLRNNLAHSQDIVSNDWPQIIRVTQRVAELSSHFTNPR